MGDLMEVAKNFQLHKLTNTQIENILNDGNINDRLLIRLRVKFVAEYTFSIISKKAIQTIKRHNQNKTIYDVMCGTGYMTKVLKSIGINTYGYDQHKILKHNYYFRDKKPYIKIHRKNALRITYDLHRGRIAGNILLSWPPYECPVSNAIIETIPKDTKVFYFGETKGGCTGSDKFHDCLEKHCELLEVCEIPQFDGVRDKLFVYNKN